MSSKKLAITDGWNLFLDRDGVINVRIPGNYVSTWDDFTFIPGALEALALLDSLMGRILVVSNQQGIGKGVMTPGAVAAIHARMIEEVQRRGGRIDAVYVSPNLEEEFSFSRKPNIGMALKARKEFPEIRFPKSLIVGDSLSDMLFGRRIGMKTVFLSTHLPDIRKSHKLIDLAFPDLLSFAQYIHGIPVHS